MSDPMEYFSSKNNFFHKWKANFLIEFIDEFQFAEGEFIAPRCAMYMNEEFAFIEALEYANVFSFITEKFIP